MGNFYIGYQIYYIKYKIKYTINYRWFDALTSRAAEYLLKKYNIGKNRLIKFLH